MRHLRVLHAITIATLTLLVSFGARNPSNAAVGEAPPSEANPALVETGVGSCVGIGDVFQVDVPGRYAALAISSFGSLLTEVRGGHGELLASSDPTMATTGAVDLLSGLRFGVAPPQVFKVESSVIIHVQHDNSPYELVLVRVGSSGKSSGLNVRPPVEQIVNESGSCLVSDLRETFKIHADAVYSDAGARQVFIVDSPKHDVSR